jgi:hypothetical protein
MRGEEDELVGEDSPPDYSCDLHLSVAIPLKPSVQKSHTIQMPAWAIGAVPVQILVSYYTQPFQLSATNSAADLPIQRFQYSACPCVWLASPRRPSSGSSSLAPRAVLTFSGIPVADAMLEGTIGS